MLTDDDISQLEHLLGQTISALLEQHKSVTTKALLHHLQLVRDKERRPEVQHGLDMLIAHLHQRQSRNNGYFDPPILH